MESWWSKACCAAQSDALEEVAWSCAMKELKVAMLGHGFMTVGLDEKFDPRRFDDHGNGLELKASLPNQFIHILRSISLLPYLCLLFSLVCTASNVLELLTRLLKIDTSSSPTSLSELVFVGDSVKLVGLLPLEFFLNTLQTTHSSYKAIKGMQSC